MYNQKSKIFHHCSYWLFNILFILSLISDSFQYNSANITNVCTSKQCELAARNLNESINRAVHPCDNFYNYACGNWRNIHETNTKYVPTDTIQLRTAAHLKEILGYLKKNNSDTEPTAVHKARKLFSLCNDIDSLDKKGLQPLKNILKLVNLTEYPPLLTHNDNFDLMTSMVRIQNLLGIDIFFRISVTSDVYNQTRNVIHISKPSPSFSRLPSLVNGKNTDTDTSPDHVSDILEAMCQNSTAKFCSKSLSIKDVVKGARYLNTLEAYQRERIQTILSPSEDDSITTEIVALQELQLMTIRATLLAETMMILRTKNKYKVPLFDWAKIIQSTFENAKNVSLNMTDDEYSDSIDILIDKQFLKRMLMFVFLYSPAEHELGLWWTVVNAYALYSNFQMRNAKLTQMEELLGSSSRQEWCTEITSHFMSTAVAHYYTTNPAYNETKTKVHQMVLNIRNAMKKMISDSKWIDDVTKEKAFNKTDSIKIKVAYSDTIASKDEVDEYYKNTEITDDFLESILKIIQEDVTNELNALNTINESNDDDSLLMISPAIVNAYFNPERNEIIIPASILGFPIYHNGLEALNYGFIGTIIGHELMHSFDKQGRHFNYEGNINNWWENNTANIFENRTLCFVKAYKNYSSNFEKHEIRTNSSITLSENISDNEGFKDALLAYRQFVSNNGLEPLLPYFENFTHEQLFTLGFANLWCEKQGLLSFVLAPIASHSPNEVRVNGVAINSKDFATIWNCPKGSNMNPDAEKCELW